MSTVARREGRSAKVDFQFLRTAGRGVRTLLEIRFRCGVRPSAMR